MAWEVGFENDRVIPTVVMDMEKGLLRPSVNRSYYAMIYAVLALLALKRKETSKHSGAISIFDKEFVKEPVIFYIDATGRF